ncbi:ankyrin repeat domain-containing protein [Motilimonas pumila]|uniref:Ankyrin repeat domain-containing protein n=1 Tax=Motilimonas pumila TaxID=2303987 RepID=A0A418YBP3_9GAMM|nr:ankyrin repeat domain-containing protein [Motilimonas pumila]RJG41896.1 ankyrin repeat domain-containing protein [Motilimonas pumila]
MYQRTAYNSKHVPLQKPAVKKGLLAKFFSTATRFSFTQTCDVLATKALSYYKPSHWHRDESKQQQQPETAFAWNEQTMGHDTMSPWSVVYLNVTGLSKFFILYFLPFSLIVLLVSFIFDDFSVSELVKILEKYALISLPFAVFWAQGELLNRGYFMLPFLKAQRAYELNRRTGMVTLYRHNKPYFTHPFIEFDCFLNAAPGHQGLMNYSLLLVHRYNGYRHGVPLHLMLPSNQLIDEYKRFWNMVQQYMDISRPLPDILMLEAVRNKDETTRIYDATHPRESHYWRQMSDEVFDQKLDALAIEQLQQPATGAVINIFAEEGHQQCSECNTWSPEGERHCTECHHPFAIDNAAIPEPALHQAVWQGDWAKARSLLAQGASIHEVNEQGRTAMDLAQEREDKLMIELLETHGEVGNEVPH